MILNCNTVFVIKVWVAKEGQEFQLAIERLIDLRKLVYLGILVSIYRCVWLVLYRFVYGFKNKRI